MLRSLTDHDYIREYGVALTSLTQHRAREVFLDYWHPSSLGSRLIAQDVFAAIMRRLTARGASTEE